MLLKEGICCPHPLCAGILIECNADKETETCTDPIIVQEEYKKLPQGSTLYYCNDCGATVFSENSYAKSIRDSNLAINKFHRNLFNSKNICLPR